ncbi:MAG: ORF4 product [Comamonadaceae bacterium]|nr:MAG: ORF4 product [Comamonadaceae bacterium]
MNCSTQIHVTSRAASAVAAMLGVAMSWSSVALAQSVRTDGGAESQWSIGLGAASVQKAYRNIDKENSAIPLLGYENNWVSFSISKLDVKLYANQSLSLRFRARYANEGYQSSDSPYLAGMDERQGGFWVGGAAIWNNDIANVTAELLGDASGNSKGARVKFQVDRRFGLGSLGVTPRLGIEWYDQKFVDYYYGVKAPEARVGRSAYQGDSSSSVEAGLRVDYSPVRQHTLFLDFGVTQFGAAIKGSPLLEKSSQSKTSIGYIYKF